MWYHWVVLVVTVLWFLRNGLSIFTGGGDSGLSHTVIIVMAVLNGLLLWWAWSGAMAPPPNPYAQAMAGGRRKFW
jgi:hypothetical protein